MGAIRERFGGFNLRSGGAPRTPGVHLSGVLRFMALESGLLRPDDEEEDLDLLLEKYPHWQQGDKRVFNRIALGLAWEEWYARQQPEDVVFHPGEFARDGITGTPDAVRITDTGEMELHEYKLTWRSSRRPIADEWMYWAQMAGYCAMVGGMMAERTGSAAAGMTGVLHVYYVNGDYAGSGPILKSYTREFTTKEIETQWAGILKHKDRARPER